MISFSVLTGDPVMTTRVSGPNTSISPVAYPATYPGTYPFSFRVSFRFSLVFRFAQVLCRVAYFPFDTPERSLVVTLRLVTVLTCSYIPVL